VKTVYHVDSDRWTPEGPKINSQDSLDAIARVLDQSGPIIVEHRHYRAGRSPDFLVFTSLEDFNAWLDGTVAGDNIWVLDYGSLCRDDNPVTHGKSPDDSGKVPLGGTY